MNNHKHKAALFFSFMTLSIPALAEDFTGLKPITPKELRHMQKEYRMRRVKKVKPNRIGLNRINTERVRRGQTPHSSDVASTFENDTEIDTTSDYDFENMGAMSVDTSQVLMGAALPTSVDNSTLPSFPPIGQQKWNNCAPWAMGYYQFTHNNGLTLGWVNNTADKTKKCSPKFIYNLINAGTDNGSYWSDNFNTLQKHGCISWANFPEDSNYKEWDTNPDHWKDAIQYRSNGVQYIYNVDTQAGLDQAKQILNNGYVLTYGTYINSWQYTTIKSNPQSSSNSLTGKSVLRYVNGTNGSHAMTIVGYDDNAWVDINNNNVVDTGELGVFKIANSWGTSWGHSGFMYVSYDALKTTSGISGGPSSGRVPAFQSKMVYHIPVRVPYTPKYLAKFTLNSAARNQLSLKFGWSTTSGSSATSTYQPFALMNQGGAYSFNGTTTPVSGTFVMDVSDLPINSSDNKVYLTVTDKTSGNATTLSSFELIDVARGTQVSANLSSPKSIDASSSTVSVNYVSGTANASPMASFTTSGISGVAPLSVNFDGAASSDSDGTISTFSWNFGDGTTSTGAYVSKTYSNVGSYTATLTVTDDEGATSSKSVVITTTGTPTSVDSTKPVVTLTNPLAGAKYTRNTTVTARATASDNVGVVKVRFYVNGYLKCTDYTASYSCSFTMPVGTKIPVRAYAYDAAGNYTISTTTYISN